MSKEKTYLKWYNKVGYGSGDVAGNVVYALLTSFVMIYLTDTIGLNAGVIGVLIAVSKIFDGITDIIFGTLIDKTHTKMGKAKPWMLYGFIGCAITLIGVFAIPMNMDNFAQYAWFFICYTLLNSVFYTANNIAYSALTALVTKNSKERVQMGSYRFIFAFGTSLLIQAVTFHVSRNLNVVKIVSAVAFFIELLLPFRRILCPRKFPGAVQILNQRGIVCIGFQMVCIDSVVGMCCDFVDCKHFRIGQPVECIFHIVSSILVL